MMPHYLAFALSLSFPCLAQVAWTRLAPPSAPGARTDSPLAHDSARQRMVLFGGFDPTNAPLADTWEWDGTTWTQQFPTNAPPARGAHGLAFDSLRNVVVLFGGAGTGASFADTWEWDGATWTQKSPVQSPPARAEHAQAFDAYTPVSRVCVFGGTPQRGSYAQALGDFWSYDGTTWTPIGGPLPGPRIDTAMTYSHSILGFVLFGGQDPNGNLLDDTWYRMSGVWSERVTGTRPPARKGHGLLYDYGRAVHVLYGGSHGGSDTWEWSWDWRPRTTASQPGARTGLGFAFDRGREHAVMFGGTAGVETWTYGPVASPHVTAFGTGCAGALGVPALQPRIGARPWIGETFEMYCTNVVPFGSALGSVGVSATSWGGLPLPLLLTAFGMPGCTLYGSIDLVLPLAPPSVMNPWRSWFLPIPNNAGLLRQHLYLQAWPFDLLNFALSNALDLELGGR